MATIERIGEVRVREAGLELLQPYIWRSRYGLQFRKELLAVQFYGVVVLRQANLEELSRQRCGKLVHSTTTAHATYQIIVAKVKRPLMIHKLVVRAVVAP
jgi:hypothetical protein